MEFDLVKRDGEVRMNASMDYIFSLLRNGEYTLKITRKTKRRTLPQNALMWMWFACLEDMSGQSRYDWHDYYVAKFLSRTAELNGRQVVLQGSTSRLTTAQFTLFLNQVQADAAMEEGCTLPLPGDRFFDDFYLTYKNRV